MKLPEIVDMMVTKEHQQEWSKTYFDKKTESRVSVNKELPEELHKQVIKKLKRKKSTQDLKKIFGQLQLKWSHCFQRMKTLSIYYV